MPSFKPFSVANEQRASAAPSASSANDGHWQSWSMQPLGRKLAATAINENNDSGDFQPNSELQKLRNEARNKAHQEGLARGQQEGYAQGYEKGLEEGRLAADKELKDTLDQTLAPLGNLIGEVDRALNQLDDNVSEQLVQLALAVGRQLAGEAMQASPETVLALVREMLHAEPMLTEKPVLILHPDDLKLVAEHLDNEVATVGWKLRPDERIERGGCRLVSTTGELDATQETRWQRIIQQLRGRHA
ncbi:flagellar assembly protein FliH [Pseudidiomarina salinarum]|uniref:flagellar assembly protein FliH n=1 Tax=Pseudidiomarina salinarum TaxID=435908 RepID=UPI00068AD1E3|nr:flagellar assembly protein FliH [Pseudidiomarina salinarum]RUO71422.1 flagellar assembly protein FliH [Pseudidiomarina salinarum]